MMDFEGVEKVRARVRQNGTLAQQLVQLQGRWQDCLPLLRSSPAAPKRRRTLPV